jgi:hypothetical protein
MQTTLLTIVLILLPITLSQQPKKKNLSPDAFFYENIAIQSTYHSSLVTFGAGASAPFHMYLMSPEQFVEFSILYPKGIKEFDYDTTRSKINVSMVAFENVEIFETGTKIVVLNPGDKQLEVTYYLQSYPQKYQPCKL